MKRGKDIIDRVNRGGEKRSERVARGMGGEGRWGKNDSVPQLHFSGAKTEAEMKNVICQDYSAARIYAMHNPA